MSNKCFQSNRTSVGDDHQRLLSDELAVPREQTQMNQKERGSSTICFISLLFPGVHHIALKFIRPLEFCNTTYRTQLNRQSVASAEGRGASLNDAQARTTQLQLFSYQFYKWIPGLPSAGGLLVKKVISLSNFQIVIKKE